MGRKGPLLGTYLVETVSCPLEAPPPPPQKIKTLHGSVRVTIPRIIRSSYPIPRLRSRYHNHDCALRCSLHSISGVQLPSCSLCYSFNLIKWGPPNRIKFPLRFLPFFCFFLFFLSSPHSLLLAAGFPCFLPFFGAKLLPVPSLQYYTCEVHLRCKDTYPLLNLHKESPTPSKIESGSRPKSLPPEMKCLHARLFPARCTSCGMLPSFFWRPDSMVFFPFLFLFLSFWSPTM